jgi:hypothetical protein
MASCVRAGGGASGMTLKDAIMAQGREDEEMLRSARTQSSNARVLRTQYEKFSWDRDTG